MFLFCQQQLRERVVFYYHQIIVMLLPPAKAPWAKAWEGYTFIYCGVRACGNLSRKSINHPTAKHSMSSRFFFVGAYSAEKMLAQPLSDQYLYLYEYMSDQSNIDFASWACEGRAQYFTNRSIQFPSLHT